MAEGRKNLCIFCCKPAFTVDERKNRNHSRKFLQFLSRFLNIQFTTGPHITDEGLLCCDECFELEESFCDLYFQWESLRLKMEWRVKELSKIMRAAGRASASVNEFGNQEVGDYIQRLREELLRGCKKRLSSSLPKVVLQRMVKEEPEDCGERVQRRVPTQDMIQGMQWLITFVAVFNLSFPLQQQSQAKELNDVDDEGNRCKNKDDFPPSLNAFEFDKTDEIGGQMNEQSQQHVYDCIPPTQRELEKMEVEVETNLENQSGAVENFPSNIGDDLASSSLSNPVENSNSQSFIQNDKFSPETQALESNIPGTSGAPFIEVDRAVISILNGSNEHVKRKAAIVAGEKIREHSPSSSHSCSSAEFESESSSDEEMEIDQRSLINSKEKVSQKKGNPVPTPKMDAEQPSTSAAAYNETVSRRSVVPKTNQQNESEDKLQNSNSGSLKCSTCGIFVSKQTLDFHNSQEHHPTTKYTSYKAGYLIWYQCSGCPYKVSRHPSIIGHVALHKPGSRAVTCSICSLVIDPKEKTRHDYEKHGIRSRNKTN